MAHELEMQNGKAMMAYNKAEKPWHGLGFAVEGDLTPEQMMKAAHLDWTVDKVPCKIKIDGKNVGVGHDALVRSSDKKVFDVVTEDWNPVQNQVAFDFFDQYVKAGNMDMETAGALKGGQLVWALARIKDSFSLFKNKDRVESYMLFTNPHMYGMSTSVSFTAIRVVCANTLNLSLNNSKGDKIVRVSHRNEFDAEQVKETLGIAHEKLAQYKEMAEFLASRKAKKPDMMEYFKHLFPVVSNKEEGSKKEMSQGAKKCLEVLDTQPGAELGEGTWWQPYNAVTFHLDHNAGRSSDSRLTSAWYGPNRNLKVKALEQAVKMAEAV